MSIFNNRCLITNLPILEGEDCISLVIVVMPDLKGYQHATSISKFFGLPMNSKYIECDFFEYEDTPELKFTMDLLNSETNKPVNTNNSLEYVTQPDDFNENEELTFTPENFQRLFHRLDIKNKNTHDCTGIFNVAHVKKSVWDYIFNTVEYDSTQIVSKTMAYIGMFNWEEINRFIHLEINKAIEEMKDDYHKLKDIEPTGLVTFNFLLQQKVYDAIHMYFVETQGYGSSIDIRKLFENYFLKTDQTTFPMVLNGVLRQWFLYTYMSHTGIRLIPPASLSDVYSTDSFETQLAIMQNETQKIIDLENENRDKWGD